MERLSEVLCLAKAAITAMQAPALHVISIGAVKQTYRVQSFAARGTNPSVVAQADHVHTVVQDFFVNALSHGSLASNDGREPKLTRRS